MTDQGSGAIYGFDDSNLGAQPPFIDDNAAQRVKTDPSQSNIATSNQADTDNQFLYDSSNWAYQDTPSYDSFNFAAASSAADSVPLFQTASWDVAPAPQQQQQASPSTGTSATYDQSNTSSSGYYPNHTINNSNNAAQASLRQALRDSVPSLRIMSKSARGEDTTEDREELHGLTPAHKLNKATVLSKATEYIRHLEKRNNRLLDENGAMQARIAAFEKLFMAGAMTGAMSPMQQPPTPMQYPQDQYINTPMGTPRGDAPQGMMTVPEDMKRIIAAQMAAGQPYPVPQQQFRGNPGLLRQQQIQQQQQAQQGARWGNNAPYFGKLMVGSLAGLMIIEAVRTEEQSNETPEGRGLFAVPMQLLSALKSSNFHVAGHVIPAAHFISHLVFMPSLFAPSDKKQKKGAEQMSSSLEPAPSLASPIHVRRQAWLTAIQTVWVPKHNFFLEAAALILKTMKLSLRNTIGVHGYQALTGFTEEQEAARVKAWSIALDAQLAGGDVEVNKSRLTLTLLASGTLPDTPLRYMLKALHIRVLLWDLGSRGIHNTIATKLARSRWNEAKQLNRILTQHRRVSEQANDDELPEHLAALLEQECDNVLNCHIIRRAYNLAWNLPTTENANEQTEGMDAVVDDQAVRSPMDAVAAWWSSQEVQRALTASLNAGKDETESQEVVSSHLDNALKAAPVASGAQARALVARAILVDEKRGASIASAIQTVQPGVVQAPINDIVSPILDSSSPAVQTPDVQVALRCAMAIAHLQRFKAGPAPRESTQLVEKLAQPSVTASMSLLGCTALFKLMTELHTHPSAAEAFSTSLERLAGSLRIWIGSTPGEQCGLDHDVRHKMVDRCLSITRSVVGMETDTGYGSMSECEEELGC
ncbi:hypothetical protein BN1708_012823 [Verticillium longisporum]|uniref:Sterol regulatory element-binding protein 1 C-terminal domain-containing protein n=1 Tax=Verticillium longisporum TaxID=100787 RepID=A0A0G4LEJ3_VERLO|nr:hypothetical protein BN1708_012823 [Verticillium longisporum]